MDITNDDEFDSFQDEPVENLTASQVLHTIQESWINERFAPEILPNQSDLVECMLGQLHHMEDNLKKVHKNDLLSVIHQLEISRIRFIITSYMRTRLQKIETFTKDILEAEEGRTSSNSQYLSPEENKFAKDYISNLETLFMDNGMKYMMGTCNQMDWKETKVKPNLYTHVFLKAKGNVEGLIVGGETVDLAAGSQHIMPYQAISNMLKEGKVQLI